jgi:hypothetical protein
MPVNIFCSYAREDEPLLKKLKAHLYPLQRSGLIDVWYDRDISAGSDWEKQIKERLNTAHIILLLVSPDFMASDYCYGIEMQRALERHEQGEAQVIPIIVRPVYWQDVLGKLQALPRNAIPVVSSGCQYQYEAFFIVTNCGNQESIYNCYSPNKNGILFNAINSPGFTLSVFFLAHKLLIIRRLERMN